MSDGTKIEWAANADGTPGATWNPIVGCSVISPGCTNCYAMREAARNERQLGAIGKESPYAGLTQPSKAGPVWNGKLRLVEPALTRPLSWKKPRTVFVNSMGDLFHDDVPEEWIDRVFAIMALCPQHTFIVLTKRSGRMRAYLNASGVKDAVVAALDGVTRARIGAARSARRIATADDVIAHNAFAARFNLEHNHTPWPLANVWLGVSTEDQQRAAERIPDLMNTPAAVRFISAEPLLGPIDLESAWHGESALDSECWGDCAWCAKGLPPLHNCQRALGPPDRLHSGLDWIIAGGESGAGARPMHPDWARGLRDQCASAGVAFFFKQWGAWAPGECVDAAPDVRRIVKAATYGPWQGGADWAFEDVNLGATDAHIDDEPDLFCVGKRAAGRFLDGRTHDDRPPLACERAR